MKNIFALLSLVIFCVSCSLDDTNHSNYSIEPVLIESVETPDYFVEGGIHTVKLYYNKISTCHFPNGVYYTTEPDNTIVIVAQNVVYHKNDCSMAVPDEDVVQEMSFEFEITKPVGTVYTFKFYQGLDQNGEESFLVIEIPVEEQNEERP